MDLASGRVSILNATAGVGVVHPGWSPDGRQIVFFRPGDKDSGGPDPVAKDAVFVIDADGQNLHQISAPSMAARFAEWSPDGARIVFVSANGAQQDVYTMRPDGSDVRRLTTDGLSYCGDVDARWVDPVHPPCRWCRKRGRGLVGDGRQRCERDPDGVQGASRRLARGPCLHLSGHAVDGWTGHRAPAVDRGDSHHRRTACAHAVPDTDPGPRARVQLDRHCDRR